MAYRPKYIFLLASIPFLYTLLRRRVGQQQQQRQSKIPHSSERILILGATSGIGRAIAHQYAERGAKVCVVGRRQELLDKVVNECNNYMKHKCFGVRGDFADVEDMVRVRNAVEAAWGGLDTLIVTAGIAAVQPLMIIAHGVDRPTELGDSSPRQASAAGIQRTIDAAAAATEGNYVGPLVAAITFIPLLTHTSPNPSILLLSSLASLIPAPSRSLYGSTKSASLLLYQSLSIEQPEIRFSIVFPATVEGVFRDGAVDGECRSGNDEVGRGKGEEEVRKVSGSERWKALKKEDVARECIRAVDCGIRSVFLPRYIRFAHLLYWIWPSFIEGRARAKYNFR